MTILAPLALLAAGVGPMLVLGRRAGFRGSEAALLALAYGPLIGIGAAAVGYVFNATLHLPRGTWGCFAASIVTFLLLLERKSSTPATADTIASPALSRIGRFERVVLVIASVLLLGGLVALTRGHVLAVARSWDGQWDAHAIWNQRARFLYSGYDGLPGAVAQIDRYFHPGYPLLLPAALASLFTIVGAPSSVTTSVLHFGIVLGCTATLLLILRRTAADFPVLAVLGPTLFVLSPTLVEASLQQGADLLTAYCILATVAALSTHLGEGAPPPVPVGVAGASLGFLLFVKNEGVAYGFVACLAFALAVRPRSAARILARIVAGILPGLLALLAFRTWFPNAEAGKFATGIAWLTDVSRWRLPLQELLARVTPTRGPGWDWRVVWAFLVLVLLGGVVLGGRRLRRADVFPALVVLGMAAVWVLVYVVTPYDQAWHITTSMSRVMTHAYPVLILAAASSASVVFPRLEDTA